MNVSLTSRWIFVEDVPARYDTILKNLGATRSLTVNRPGWNLPRLVTSIRQLERRFPDLEIDGSIVEILTPANVRVFDSRLYSYQNDGVSFLLRGSGLLSFDPGLGKTATSIVAADCMTAQRVLIVAPLTLLPMWQKEIGRWAKIDRPIHIIRDGTPPKKGPCWVITNYDRIARHPEAFECDWDVLILDESILVKNRDTKRFRSLEKVRRHTKTCWALSGFPVSNNVSDLWAQFRLLHPDKFKSFWRFANEFCILEQTPWGTSIVGSLPSIDFPKEFPDILFRTSKADVVTLPPMFFETVECSMTTRQEAVYTRILKEFLVELSTGNLPVTTRVAQITRLAQVVSNLGNLDDQYNESGKLDSLAELTEARHFKFPAIVWVRYIRTGLLITQRLRRQNLRVELIQGDTPPDERERILMDFRRGVLDFVVMSTAVGKFGLTLTEAETVIYFEKSFSLDDYAQSLDRVHRLGLDHSPFVISLTCPGTIDDLVADNLEGKSIDLGRLTSVELSNLLGGLGRGKS